MSLLPQGLGLNEWLQRMPRSLPVGTTPSIEIERRGSIRLIKYEAQTFGQVHEPVVIIPSLINRPYVLDLLPGKSLIEFLTQQGFNVYLIDWGAPADEDRHLTFEALVQSRIGSFLERAMELEMSERVHLIGHCLGGTLAGIFASLHPQKVLSLTLLTTPIHFPSRGKLSVWAQHPSFDVDAFIEAYGHAPWALLQTTFQAVKPTMWLKKAKKVLDKRTDSEFQKNFWALEIWTNDNISLIGPAYRTVLMDLYRRNALADSELHIGAERVTLKRIQCPVLNVYAKDDHIVLPEAVLRSSDLADGIAYQEFPLQGGHVGAILSGKSQKTLWPKLAQWMLAQETQES